MQLDPIGQFLLLRIAFRHLVEKTFLLQFLQKAHVDELVGLAAFACGLVGARPPKRASE
jgi:hypothetical protein